MLKIDVESLIVTDCRNGAEIYNYGLPNVTYTLKTDDITKGAKPVATPYVSRRDSFELSHGEWRAEESGITLRVLPDRDGVRYNLICENQSLSEWGIALPFNFQGKKNGGGWLNQYLLSSAYITKDRKFKSFYLTNPNGNNLLVAVMSDADGWKMDYSPYLAGMYFLDLKVLANFDRAYGDFAPKSSLSVGVYPVTDYESALALMSKLYDAPFMYADYLAGKIGKEINLSYFGECDALLEKYGDKETVIPQNKTYLLHNEGDTELVPLCKGKRGAGITVYGYSDIIELYKKTMDTVDLELVKNTTDGNLCEQQAWAGAMLKFLLNHKERLNEKEIAEYEGKLKNLLDRVTETDPLKAEKRLTIFKEPIEDFPAFNIFKSRRIQEQYFGINILLDSYRYFGDEKYLEYAIGATDSLIDNYQKENGSFSTDHGGKNMDYTAVCTVMFPLIDMAEFLDGRDDERAKRYRESARRAAEFLWQRGLDFKTEGMHAVESADPVITDGGIACTMLGLLYYAKHIEADERYIAFAKKLLDIHESFRMYSPISQIKGSSLRWWETKWEGDADGPALNCGHGWTIWRAESDWLYYKLTGDEAHLKKAINGFNCNIAKINEKGESFSIYNVDDINGGGFTYTSEEINFRIAPKFPDVRDSGLSRYVFTRAEETLIDLL